MITFDLQQNLPTPNLNHNDIFYLRQLWTYNFGIHDCVTEQGYMFMWHEALAKRGASEISSCLKVPILSIFIFPSDPVFHAMNFGEKIFRFG